MKTTWQREARRIALIVLGSLVMAANIKIFVRAGGLFPGGFNGLTILIQRVSERFFSFELPFTIVNLSLNAIPAIISFKFIGKKFTLYSCVMIALTSFFTDLLPSIPVTSDILLISIFGGIINGCAIGLCLLAEATSGGTDFIAIFISEKYKRDVWNYIFIANIVILLIAGYLFGWDKALYSILFQYASTQIVQAVHLRYKKHTLFIITDQPEAVYQTIRENTRHGGTIFTGTGGFQHAPRSMVYSVVSSAEVKHVVGLVMETDPHAFVNVVKTDQLSGRFYQKPTD